MSVESHLDGDCGGLLKAPVSHSDNLETAAVAAGPPLPVDPPLLTPLPGSKSWAAPTNWAEAKEFVPKVKVEKPRSWAQVVNTGVTYPGCEVKDFLVFRDSNVFRFSFRLLRQSPCCVLSTGWGSAGHPF